MALQFIIVVETSPDAHISTIWIINSAKQLNIINHDCYGFQFWLVANGNNNLTD
jgi:hypothetical protein